MFFGKGKRGLLFKEYKKLKPEKIIKELDLKKWDQEQIIFIIYKLALYGGLHLQNTLREKGFIKNSNQDSVFIEGTAYTWANLHFSILSDHNLPLYDEDIIVQGLNVGGGVLAELLTKNSKVKVDKNFSAFYQGANRLKASEILNAKLLTIPSSGSSDPLKYEVGVVMAVGVFEATIQKGLTGSVKAMLNMYLDNK
jgi:hypothetical protein